MARALCIGQSESRRENRWAPRGAEKKIGELAKRSDASSELWLVPVAAGGAADSAVERLPPLSFFDPLADGWRNLPIADSRCKLALSRARSFYYIRRAANLDRKLRA